MVTYKKVAFMGRLEKKAEICEGPHQIRYAKCIVRIGLSKRQERQRGVTQETLLQTISNKTDPENAHEQRLKPNTVHETPQNIFQNTVKHTKGSRPKDAGLRTVFVLDEHLIDGFIASLKERDMLFVEGNLREVPINTLANTSVGFSKVFSENPYLVVSSYEGCLQKLSSVPRGDLS